jgi:hypothetical protein
LCFALHILSHILRYFFTLCSSLYISISFKKLCSKGIVVGCLIYCATTIASRNCGECHINLHFLYGRWIELFELVFRIHLWAPWRVWRAARLSHISLDTRIYDFERLDSLLFSGGLKFENPGTHIFLIIFKTFKIFVPFVHYYRYCRKLETRVYNYRPSNIFLIVSKQQNKYYFKGFKVTSALFMVIRHSNDYKWHVRRSFLLVAYNRYCKHSLC